MRQLARTLLILGSVTACERAHPLVDMRERPAVGNIGQTGRPGAIAIPVVDASGAPAVGNIGQTGAPHREVTRERPRRVQRVQRAVRTATHGEVHTARVMARVREVERPLVSREERPMVGNIMQKGGARSEDVPTTQLAIQSGASSAAAAANSPLLDRRERPAVANMGRRSRMLTPAERLEQLAAQIAMYEEYVRTTPTDAARRSGQQTLDDLNVKYRALAHAIAHGVARDGDEP
jgi:hypothetical protein